MKPVVLSIRADADMSQIRGDGIKQWGVERSDRYLDDLRLRLRSLGAHPERHPLAGPSRPAVRRIKSGRHIIFYREEPARVLIMRILHERMEHARRL